ncbi:MAG: hypothetical protein ACK5NY_06560 [Burkholderiaceae bacterium]|jgi:hypothetical protein
MKLDWKLHWLALLKSLPANLGLLSPALLLVAVCMVVVATHSTRKLVSQIYSAASAQQSQSVEVRKIPLRALEYQSYVSSMRRLSPVVRFEQSRGGDAIEVSVDNADSYAEFMYALASLQSFSESVIWEAQEVCVAGCEGAASKAVIKGFKQQFVLN